MKKILLIIITASFCLPVLGQGNSGPFGTAYRKFAGQEGYTSVEISSEMLRLLGSSGNGSPAGITNIRILVCERDQSEFREVMDRAVNADLAYKLMTSVNKGSERIRFLFKEKKGRNNTTFISELLMLKYGDDECVAICIEGNIDLNNISGLSGLGIGGMEQLGSLGQDR